MKSFALGIALAAAAALPACISINVNEPSSPETAIHHIYQGNPLATRSDLQRAAVDVLRPLLPYYSENGARLHQGYTGASYPDSTAEMEAFSRPVWALGPLWAGGGDDPALRDVCVRGLIAGTDPDTSLARVIAFYEIIWEGERFIKSAGIIWPLFYTGAFYLIFSGLLTLLFGYIEKKLDYFK